MLENFDDFEMVERGEGSVVVEYVQHRVGLQTFEHVSGPVGGVGVVRGGGGRVEMGAGLVEAPLDQLHLERQSTASLIEQRLRQRHLVEKGQRNQHVYNMIL